MDTRQQHTTGWAVATLAYGLGIAFMFTIGTGFEPVFFGVLTGLWLLALLGVALAFRARARAPEYEEREFSAGELTPSRRVLEALERTSGAVKATSLQQAAVETPLVVQPAIEQPIAAVGFEYRGFTLYQRPSRKKGAKPVYLFSKGKVPGARPTSLPEDYGVEWDGKKRRPSLAAPKPVKPLVEEPEPLATRRPARSEGPTLVAAPGKLCSAMTGFATFCSNPARDGSKFCAKHASYKPGAYESKVEFRTDRTKAARPVRFGGGPVIEVKTPRGTGRPKPIRVAAPNLVIRTAKPQAPKPLKIGWGRVEVQPAKAKRGKPIDVGWGKVEIRAPKATVLAPVPWKTRSTPPVPALKRGVRRRGR